MRVLKIIGRKGFSDLPVELSENEFPSALARAIAGEKYCVHAVGQCDWPAHVVEEVPREDDGRTIAEGFFNPEQNWCLYMITNHTSGEVSHYCGSLVGN